MDKIDPEKIKEELGRVPESKELLDIWRQWEDGVITLEEVAIRYIHELRIDLTYAVLQRSYDLKAESLKKGDVHGGG